MVTEVIFVTFIHNKKQQKNMQVTIATLQLFSLSLINNLPIPLKDYGIVQVTNIQREDGTGKKFIVTFCNVGHASKTIFVYL